ncbi:MAG: DUF3972 domain-containing protein [Sneathiellales bacterium]|nr:DUF3972 domain-containing protein [Sneathiellales bacterium]
MKLTLGQAAKEVGISKPSLSAAIKKGRISAIKNDSGAYEIDPSELFRVYPPKKAANEEVNSKSLPETNPSKNVSPNSKDNTLSLLLAERDKLLDEKDKAIRRLEEEKSELREDLQEQREQAKRITLLLEDKSSGVGDDLRRSLDDMENRFEAKLMEQNKSLRLQEEERDKTLREQSDLKKSIMVYKLTFATLIVLTLIGLALLYGKDFL